MARIRRILLPDDVVPGEDNACRTTVQKFPTRTLPGLETFVRVSLHTLAYAEKLLRPMVSMERVTLKMCTFEAKKTRSYRLKNKGICRVLKVVARVVDEKM